MNYLSLPKLLKTWLTDLLTRLFYLSKFLKRSSQWPSVLHKFSRRLYNRLRGTRELRKFSISTFCMMQSLNRGTLKKLSCSWKTWRPLILIGNFSDKKQQILDPKRKALNVLLLDLFSFLRENNNWLIRIQTIQWLNWFQEESLSILLKRFNFQLLRETKWKNSQILLKPLKEKAIERAQEPSRK